MTLSTTIPKTGISYIDGLLTGRKWDASELTFSFPAESRFYGTGYNNSGEPQRGFSSVGDGTQEAIRMTLDMISAVSGLSFREVTESETVHGDLRFGFSTAQTHSAWSYYPGDNEKNGDVWFSPSIASRVSSYQTGFQTIAHEIGHALGLKHTFENYGDFPVAEEQYRYFDFTVMDYYGSGIGRLDGEPQTLQRGDIAALQALYGANFETYGGDTTYSFRSDGSMTIREGSGPETVIADGSRPLYRTIWDGNGKDTYDAQYLSEDLTIDLRPGEGSVLVSEDIMLLNYVTGRTSLNIYNAFQYNDAPRSLIENANAGAGNDTILGNAANNRIRGGGGDDTIYGGDGNDELLGDQYGYDGNDVIYGGNGNDRIYGDGGNDLLYGEDGDDIINGGDGDDLIDGGDGDDRFFPGAGADTVIGGAGKDRVDLLGSSAVQISLQEGRGYGGYAEGDTYSGIEDVSASEFHDILIGSDAANTLRGEGGNDRLDGGNGDDMLLGGTGNDFLEGGSGNDSLWGGSGLSTENGSDTFIFKSDFGHDVIGDFEAGAGLKDVLEFSIELFQDYQSVLAAATQVGNDTVITFDHDNSITLADVQLTSLHADDFSFFG